MEHRCCERKVLKIKALLYRNGLPVQSGQTRNLGLDGVQVEVTGWRRHESLKVELAGSHRNEVIRLPATVVYQGQHAVGLVFEMVTEDQRTQLRSWLSASGEGLDPLATTVEDTERSAA